MSKETWYNDFKLEMFKRFNRELTDKEMIEVLVQKNSWLQEQLDEAYTEIAEKNGQLLTALKWLESFERKVDEMRKLMGLSE
jgi:hypothetical protein